MRILTCILILLFGLPFAHGQGYADNWAVNEEGGISFTLGQPVFFNTQGKTFHSGWFFNAVASISDKNGSLQFYASGDSVFNKNHVMMQGGFGLNSFNKINMGYPMIVIPSITNQNQYFLFYVGRIYGSQPSQWTVGAFYSIIDMSLNNGFGAVTQKNIRIGSPSQTVVASNIAATYNETKNCYELFYRTADPFIRRVIVDSTGITLDPSNYSGHQDWRFNTKGTKAISPVATTSAIDIKMKTWDYNPYNSTFTIDKEFVLNGIDQIMDVCFSPSGKYLYIACRDNSTNYPKLYRFDVSLPDSSMIKNSKVNLINGNYPLPYQSLISSLQLAPDQKIYAAVAPKGNFNQNFYIGVINHPDSTYTGNFNPTAVNVQGKKTLFFPNFVLNWMQRPPFSLRHACQDSVVFDLTYKNIVDSVYWDFGDPASGPANHSNLLSPVHHYTSYGAYWVQVTTCWQGECDTLADSVFVEPVPMVTLPNDTLLCAGESLFVDVGQGFNANYLWNTGSTDSTAVLDKTGQYIVHAYNNCGSHADTINISVFEPPVAQLKDTIACDNFQIVLHIVADSASYLWSTGATEPTIYPTVSGTYTVDVQNPCGAIQDQATVTYKKCICNVYVANAFTPNNDGTNDYFKPIADCPEFSYTMQIFNRWGNVIAELNESSNGWDGTQNGQLAPNGVYTYRMVYTGREYERQIEKEIFGTVSLMR